MSLACCGVACLEENICEMDGTGVAVRVPIGEVRSVTLGHGYQAPHHIIQLILGGLLIVPGFWAGFVLIRWALHRGDFGIPDGIFLAIALAGIWLVATALAKGYYLDVHTTAGRRRLRFDENVTPEEIRSFLPTLDVHLGVPIESQVQEIPFSSHLK